MSKLRKHRLRYLAVPIALALAVGLFQLHSVALEAGQDPGIPAGGGAPSEGGAGPGDVPIPTGNNVWSDDPEEEAGTAGEASPMGEAAPGSETAPTGEAAPTGEIVIAEEPTALASGEDLFYDPQPQSDMEVLEQVGDYLTTPDFRSPRWKEPLAFGWTPCRLTQGRFTDPDTGLVYWTVGVFE